MELIRKSDALHAVLHNTGDAAVAAVQNIKPINPHGEMREWMVDMQIEMDALRAENDRLKSAADALEAADEKIADYTAAIDALDDSNDAYIKENERLKKRIADLETALAACRMRKGEAPKRGEWEERYIEDANPMFRRRFYCSRCGEWTTHGKTRYCPNCGAVMYGKEKDK